MSIDVIDKTYAVQFGYVFRDFLHFESIELWTDIVSPKTLERRGQYIEPANKNHHQRETKLSQDSKENARVFKQLKYNLAYSETLTLLHIINI